MLPLDRLHAVSSDTLVTEALETMGREDVNQLPVVNDGRLAGIISSRHILRTLQTRAELRV
jgi:CBS domain-containing protein